MDNTKPAWQSKTLWVNAILAVAAIAYPPANVYITAHPEFVTAFFAVVNIALRFITKKEIVIG